MVPCGVQLGASHLHPESSIRNHPPSSSPPRVLASLRRRLHGAGPTNELMQLVAKVGHGHDNTSKYLRSCTSCPPDSRVTMAPARSAAILKKAECTWHQGISHPGCDQGVISRPMLGSHARVYQNLQESMQTMSNVILSHMERHDSFLEPT